MPEESLSTFSYDHANVPPLPDATVPGSVMTFDQAMQPLAGQQQASAENGIPMFEVVAVHMADGSYNNVEFVSVLTPGDPKSVPRHKVTQQVIDKYKIYYDLWKQNLKVSPIGTPLEMWPVLMPAQVFHLKGLNIFTVEQLCNMADSGLHRIPMGETLRHQARDWMDSKKDADILAERSAETLVLKDGQKLLETKVIDMAKQMEEILASNAALEKQVKASAAKLSKAGKD